MKALNFRKTLLALLVAASMPAWASSFYVVVPVPAKKVSNDAISVSLSAYTAPGGQVGFAYQGFDLRTALSVTGDPGYTGYGVKWQILDGSLPAGLTLNSNGTVTGTPTAAGSYSFTVRASYKTKTGDQQYQIATYLIDVGLASGTPPQALVGQAYSYNLNSMLTVKGDPYFTGAGVTWSVVSSSLPAGLYLTSGGVISGTPTAGGTGTITARATYKGVAGEQTYQVVSLSISVALNGGTPPQALVGQTYSYDLAPLLSVSGDPAFNGSGVTWSVVSSSLPAGLSLTSDGRISGTPTASGTGSITARATYKNGSGQQTYEVVALNITVSLAGATLPVGVTGNSYPGFDFKSVLSVTGDAAYTPSAASWSVVSGSLPAGMALSANGVVSGTPSTAATSNFTLKAAYKNKSAQYTYALQVDQAQVPGALSADAGTDFGVFGLGGAATRTFTFVNNGNTAATGLYASVSGTGYALWASTCGSPGAPITLAKGASCNFTARFSPGTPGVLNGTVAVNWSGPNTSSKTLAVTGATTVDYSWLMGSFPYDTVPIGKNAAWVSGLQWYWSYAGAESSAAPGAYEFRRTITIGGTAPVTVYLFGAVDDNITAISVNGATVYGNVGMPFDAWRYSPPLTLQPGINVIGVQVTNGGTSNNPAGMALQVRWGDGSVIAGEGGWKRP
ncbi:putative Ig domain-containing protein [Burkholderia ubonensis]|uniref:putative Ig domain-containing protein n=1 Tax=Burkholderia ubonensis TaxID=101571 RepID=UPI00075B657E|nr:putative Ig domain-containing protein [Burkholderia ubonensis]KVP39937.1 hypothetical protein WJ87_07065 [Burkholderia ubonensis]